MWGLIFGLAQARVCGVVAFSLCILSRTNLCFFWLYLELGTLSLVPSFFLSYGGSSYVSSLLLYLVVSGVSSALIVCGVLYESLLGLRLLGLLVKFGVFPFRGWVIRVVCKTNWLVVWGISTFLKLPFLFIPFFLSAGGLGAMKVLCLFTFLVLSLLMWLKKYRWKHCWCYIMISSSTSLVVISPVLSTEILLDIFVFYLVWARMVIWALRCCGRGGVSGSYAPLLFFFLLLSFPGRLCVFYKLMLSSAMLACDRFMLVSWIVYNVSEQFFILRFLVGTKLPRSEIEYLEGV